MNRKRVDLAELGAKAAASDPPSTPAALTAAPEQSPRRRRRPAAAKPAPSAGHVRFDELERKETRLRADQLEALAAATKRLNRARNRSGERITDNTLIRVAVDLLLARDGELSGTTEAELRKSVNL